MVKVKSTMVATLAAASSLALGGARGDRLTCLTPYQNSISLAKPNSSLVSSRCDGSKFDLSACRVVRKESTSQKQEERTHRKAAAVVFEGKSPGGMEIMTGKCHEKQTRFFVFRSEPPYGLSGFICKPKYECSDEGFQILQFNTSTLLKFLGTMFNITDWNGKEALSEGELSLFTLGDKSPWTAKLSSMPVGSLGSKYQFDLDLNFNGSSSTYSFNAFTSDVEFTSIGDVSAICNRYTCGLIRALPVNSGRPQGQKEPDQYNADYSSVIYIAVGVASFIGLLCLCLCAVKIKERY